MSADIDLNGSNIDGADRSYYGTVFICTRKSIFYKISGLSRSHNLQSNIHADIPSKEISFEPNC